MNVRVYVKRQLRLDRLTFVQRQMFKLGTVATAAVISRASRAITPAGAAAKPLAKPYAIRKTRLGKGNRRNLMFTGDMLRNLRIRTVTENKATAGFSTRSARLKARANQEREEFLAFSAENERQVAAAGQKILVEETAPRLILARELGIKS